MAINDPCFTSALEHQHWLQQQAALPAGFRVGCAVVPFVAEESGKPARSTLTLITVDEPTPAFAACFTRNAFPGAPIIVGRERLQAEKLAGLVINNKISNVCAPQGVERARALSAALAQHLAVPADWVIPSSTGIIGWRLPAEELIAGLPTALGALQGDSILPAAEGIVTTDLYAKIRRFDFPGGGSIVGIAKGAGMVEPNLATMLVYLLSDVAIKRDQLRQALSTAVGDSFNTISIDSDQSTSDTVLAMSSQQVSGISAEDFAAALNNVCSELAEDVVRNGEGVRHVQRIEVCGAPNAAVARAIGKSVINAPLWKTALAGNDPNVGRLVMAVGKEIGNHHPQLDAAKVTIAIGEHTIFSGGQFTLNPAREAYLKHYFVEAELYPASPAADGITFVPPVRYPPHPRSIVIRIDLQQGEGRSWVIGGDLTHEYITENADYRS